MSVLPRDYSSIQDPWMRQAALLAEKGRGKTSPNPLVGCVVVRDDQVVGSGYHARAGEAHAEVIALRDAGDSARGAHVAVTLEPCNHTGKTPPCSEALIAAGVASVAIGMPDPNRGVVGGGADRLRAAGIRVEMAPDPSPFRELNEAWIHWLSTGSPLVTVKIALSLDGRPSLAEGKKAQITGRGGARLKARLRRISDAVAVGAGTLSIDDPSLTVRDEDGRTASDQPERVIISRISLPDVTKKVFTDGLGTVTVVLSDAVPLDSLGAFTDVGVRVLHYSERDGVAGAISALGEEGIVSLLVEPGPGLFVALWEADAVDQLVTVVAGGIAGGDSPSIYSERVDGVSDQLERRMIPTDTAIVGESSVTVWKRTSDTLK